MEIQLVKDHIRNRPYMSGVDRDRLRIKQTGEVFTPQWLAQQVVDELERKDPAAFSDPARNFLDPACGDGNLLGEVLIRKMERGMSFGQALTSIYGIDLMPDNVKLCQERLLCGSADPSHCETMLRNIIHADSLDPRFNWQFNGTDPYETEQDQHIKKFFQFE